MQFSAIHIVLAAAGIMTLVGAMASVSAWRHVVREERRLDARTGDGLAPSA